MIEVIAELAHRSTAPNSLSIWTKHIRGIDFHDSFKPQGCVSCSTYPAVTLGAGEDWGSIYSAAAEHSLTLVGGTGDTIGLGGYLTGGGHSPLSAKLGLAVDQVLEMEVELACGNNMIVNQVQNTDLFWALRGVRLVRQNRQNLKAKTDTGRRRHIRSHHFGDSQNIYRDANRGAQRRCRSRA